MLQVKGLIGREIVKQFKERDSIVIDADISNETPQMITHSSLILLKIIHRCFNQFLIANMVGLMDGKCSISSYKRLGEVHFEESPFPTGKIISIFQLNSVFILANKS